MNPCTCPVQERGLRVLRRPSATCEVAEHRAEARAAPPPARRTTNAPKYLRRRAGESSSVRAHIDATQEALKNLRASNPGGIPSRELFTAYCARDLGEVEHVQRPRFRQYLRMMEGRGMFRLEVRSGGRFGRSLFVVLNPEHGGQLIEVPAQPVSVSP